LYDDARTF